MGAAGLIDIKRRIKSVESTRKITKAMGLVATSKLRKARKELAANEQYNKLSKEILDEVIISLPDDYESIYFDNNGESEKLYIVLTSDTGLCGGFNNNIISFLNSKTEKNSANSRILVVGGKGVSYMQKFGLSSFNEYIDIPDIPTIKEVKRIFSDAISMYKNGEVSEVNIVYTEFKSPVKQETKSVKLLPFNREINNSGNYIIEPNVDRVFTESMDLYLKSQLRACMLSSKASEQSARMTAMDGATENANDILQSLHIKFNRIRQSIITQEISEIVGGAEAQK